jgi:hypothetical protein
MEPLPETTRKYCDILVSVSADLKNTGEALGNLMVTLPADQQKVISTPRMVRCQS